MAGASGAVWGVAEAVADQGPFPALVTARSCTSYRTPLVRLDRAYSRAPDVQMPSRSVQSVVGLVRRVGPDVARIVALDGPTAGVGRGGPGHRERLIAGGHRVDGGGCGYRLGRAGNGAGPPAVTGDVDRANLQVVPDPVAQSVKLVRQRAGAPDVFPLRPVDVRLAGGVAADVAQVVAGDLAAPGVGRGGPGDGELLVAGSHRVDGGGAGRCQRFAGAGAGPGSAPHSIHRPHLHVIVHAVGQAGQNVPQRA